MSTQQRYLCFNLGKEEFAIPLLTVKEVIGVPELTPIPQMPPYFLGMMNLRGNVITVMDLRTKLGIKPQPSEEQAVVIVEIGHLRLGCVVDCVNAVMTLNQEEVLEKPHMENSKASQAVTGVIRKEQGLILVIDIAKALSLDDKSLMSQAQQGQSSKKAA
jgi:purine-binding chemotaxis protein CheW